MPNSTAHSDAGTNAAPHQEPSRARAGGRER
jgi:hypothetical protein